MNKGFTLATAVLAGGLAAPAQTLPEHNAVFQYFSTDGVPAMPVIAQKPVTGRPMAATESRHTLQVLADGTRIERRDTSKYYRDSEGRTRTESADGTRVNITDPANGSTVEMNTTQHSARHTGMVRAYNFKTETTGPVTASGPVTTQSRVMTIDQQTAGIKAAIAGRTEALDGVQIQTGPGSLTIVRRADSASAANDAKTENLGIQSVNGVLAEGTRTTITIPAGEIGNDRPISIVNEKWVSTSLGMLVKSVNSDPRFGETTYELTDIQEGVQDPSLFQVPADYNQGAVRRDW
jgi:hypothetical protein